MATLPTQYAWLAQEPGPRLLAEALREFGTIETPGTPDNPRIIAWADEVAAACNNQYANWAADFYNDDAIPWCGLAVAIWTARSAQGRPERLPGKNYLSALAWAGWGVSKKKEEAMLGDVLVFVRKGGGHVGIYVGEDDKAYHTLGGNQSDCVCVARMPKERLYAVRRPPYNQQPANVRKIPLAANGKLSSNEQ